MGKILQGARGIEVRPSPLGGYGVFATQLISQGETVEECYYLPLRNPWEATDSGIKKYVFRRATGLYGSPVSPYKAAVVLGCGMIYNHSSRPNVTYSQDILHKIFRFTAFKDISPNKELFIDYGNASLAGAHIKA